MPLLSTTIDNHCRDLLEKYYAAILQVLFTRLQNSKTESFTLRFVRFYHFFCAKDDKGLGADFFINVAEQIQSGYVSNACALVFTLRTDLTVSTQNFRPALPQHHPARHPEIITTARPEDRRDIPDEDLDQLCRLCREVQEGMGSYV